MINDVLEQLAEDYFRHLGYFTQHNVKYRPNRRGPAYNVHSDVDIVAVHPKKKSIDRVIVVSCKSWHGGLHIMRELKRLKENYRRTRQTFRELAMPVWSRALKNKIKEITGQKRFVFYIICVSYDHGYKKMWEENKIFKRNLSGCKIKLLDFKTMIEGVKEEASGITPAHSELTRLLQFINQSGGNINYNQVSTSTRLRSSKKLKK